MSALMSLREAAKAGITKVHADIWANPLDHLEITIVSVKDQSDMIGPWVKLWSPINRSVCEQENPQTFLITLAGDLDDRCWREYVGPPGEPWKPEKKGDNHASHSLGVDSGVRPAPQ
jgi:hypothetical protein